MSTPDIIVKVLRDYFRWTAIAVVVLVLSLSYGLVLSKKISVIQTISFSDRTKAKNDLAAASAYLTTLQSSIEKFQRQYTATDRARLDRLLPTASEFPDLLLTIDNMASVAGLDLRTINVTNISTASTEGAPATAAGDPATTEETIGVIANVPGLAAQDISVTVGQGTSYEQFKRFLAIVESSGRLFDIINLTYVRPGDAAEASAVYAFTLRAYYLTETDQAPTS